MEIPILKDIVIIFALAIAVLLLCHRFKIPSIVGFLITGILCGPQSLGLVSAIDDVKALAEIGIVVLLFTIGMEFSLKKLSEYKRYILIGGALQVSFTILVGFLAAKFVGKSFGESIFLGMLLSLSSTAIVMRVLQDRSETNSPHGRLILGILIFQDVIVVFMMLITPFLTDHVMNGMNLHMDRSLLLALIKGVLILGITFITAIIIVPRLLYYVAKTRSRELFLLTMFVICFTVAWITSSIGLSLALGAFLAGLTISDTEYRYHAMGDIVPFQDIFTSLFFVSIGMLLDIEFFLENPFSIILMTTGILFSKTIVVTIGALASGLPLRSAILSGISLSQVGEFSFVLAMVGMSHHIGTEYLHQLFLAVAIMTMGLTPTLIAISPKIANTVSQLPFFQFIDTGPIDEELQKSYDLKDHIIIVGYGFTGMNLARSSKEASIPYVILDMNPETVRKEKLKGEPIHFGDASKEKVLQHANIQHAKAIAVLINDPIAALRIVEHAKVLNENIYVIVRTRYLEETRPFYQVGADEVIPDELGVSVEVFTRILMKYDVSAPEIDHYVVSLRAQGYEILNPRYTEGNLLSDLKKSLKEVGVESIKVGPTSILLGKTLAESALRKKYGVTLLAIKKPDKTIYDIGPDTVLISGDEVVVVGTEAHLKEAMKIFNP